MSNHYHILAWFKEGNIIPKLMNHINGGSSFYLKKDIETHERLWGEYHILIPPNELVCERMRGYVIGNPLKHDEVSSLKQLFEYPYSTFKQHVSRFGRDQSEELVNSVIEMDEIKFFKRA